jgi:hypothetical protein
MPPLDDGLSQHLYDAALCAAFWVAVWQLRGGPTSGLRLVAGLALGALFGRTGGLAFVPAGLLLAAPWRGGERADFLDAALPALPLSFAVAKLGCVAASCCAVAGAEAIGFAAVGVGLRLTRARAGALALAGIALVRLAVLPFRPEATLSALPAAAWLATAALLCRPFRGGGRATSSRTEASSRLGSAAGSERFAR